MKAEKMMNRRSLGGAALCIAASAVLSLPLSALAADEAPDALIKRLSADVLNTVKSDKAIQAGDLSKVCLLYTSPSPRDRQKSRMPSSA